jgi:hypothetical protein
MVLLDLLSDVTGAVRFSFESGLASFVHRWGSPWFDANMFLVVSDSLKK